MKEIKNKKHRGGEEGTLLSGKLGSERTWKARLHVIQHGDILKAMYYCVSDATENGCEAGTGTEP